MSSREISLTILLIDDDPDMRQTIRLFLEARHHTVRAAASGREGMNLLSQGGIDVVVTDLKMPETDGFQVLKAVKERAPEVEVIVMTAFGDMETAVRALRQGAFDFLTKPFDVQDLSGALQRTLRFQALKQERDQLQARLNRIEAADRNTHGLDAIVGESSGICGVRDLIRQVSATAATSVLITGETGTGKELVARAIHLESERRSKPFVAVDCSAVPESLVESEFYGHVKGSFTDAREDRVGHFVLADGGTLLLDEIGDMAPSTQAKLLRTLEERCVRQVGGTRETPIDVRVVSATNRNLSDKESQFRRDLYYRLNAFTIPVPPLRDRTEDIPLIAEHLVVRFAREMRKPILGFTDPAIDALRDYPFPGNVRELRNLVERASILCGESRIDIGHLRFDPLPDSGTQNNARSIPDTSGVQTLAELESDAICAAMRRAAGNQVRASELLGITRDALRRRLQRYGIDPEDFRPPSS